MRGDTARDAADHRMWADPIAASTGAAQARFEENPGVATEIPRA
ncbi:MAG: hypothetical protein ACRDRB_10070 [Pseudonocardiaceae bacterium]